MFAGAEWLVTAACCLVPAAAPLQAFIAGKMAQDDFIRLRRADLQVRCNVLCAICCVIHSAVNHTDA